MLLILFDSFQTSSEFQFKKKLENLLSIKVKVPVIQR